ncbi:MAG: ABC transporter ATP-binding protein [Azoarcus sp.]|jgi:NitT/TauT family transport system ATP-binding protein|nr:ABC transporter ATP-binding protein [Azoarcus sp.]
MGLETMSATLESAVSSPGLPWVFVRERSTRHDVVVSEIRQPLIRIRDVEMRYPSERGEDAARVLAGVNLDIHEGEFHVLLGPSGCGKSTLLNIIVGLARQTAGTVTMRGRVIRKPDRERGLVFQNADAAIFPWLSVLENVEFGLRMASVKKAERRAIALKYVDLVGLRGHEGKFPHELSGGMKQRTQIARLLANDSAVLVMDEPFGALDAHTRRIMQNELVRTWRETGKTVIFVTHDIQEALLLGQWIHIMSKTPDANIYKTYRAELAYPRTEANPHFIELLTRIQGHFDFGSGI